MPRSFQLVETLGEGAFGAVYLAEVTGDEGFVQRLAVKMLHPHWSNDVELARRLRDEARLLALLEHDHVVRVHGLTRIDGRLAILMEPVLGVDLSAADGEAVPPRAAVEIVEAVADALRAAWDTVPPGQEEPLRVVHRDIKPSNIMVTERGGVKVMDFGVARARFDAREAATRSQQFGTARYMAPERWLHGVADAPSDIFSLGITLIELVRGDPFPRPRLSESSFREDIDLGVVHIEPEALQSLIRRMVSFEASERPTSSEVVAACHALAETIEGPTLRAWAADWVAERRRATERAPETVPMSEEGSGETFTLIGTAKMPLSESLTPSPVTVPLDVQGQPVPAVPASNRRGFFAGIALTLLLIFAWSLRGLFLDPAPTVAAAPELDLVDTEPADPQPAADPPSAEPPAPSPVLAPPTAPQPEAAIPAPANRSPAPAPNPTPVPVPVPQPVPATEPQPEAPAPATVTFILTPPSLVATTDAGALSNRGAVALARGVHEIRVTGSEGNWRCAVRIDAPISTWRVDDTTQRCARSR